jgi:hypothetical protein
MRTDENQAVTLELRNMFSHMSGPIRIPDITQFPLRMMMPVVEIVQPGIQQESE